MTFIIVLFVGLLVFMVWSFVALVSRVTRFGRNVRNIYRAAQEAAGMGDAGRDRENASEKKPVRKKKIEKNVGEYVEFEEIAEKITVAEDDRGTRVAVEQQVTDAEWEDIP